MSFVQKPDPVRDQTRNAGRGGPKNWTRRRAFMMPGLSSGFACGSNWNRSPHKKPSPNISRRCEVVSSKLSSIIYSYRWWVKLQEIRFGGTQVRFIKILVAEGYCNIDVILHFRPVHKVFTLLVLFAFGALILFSIMHMSNWSLP